ncbi:outer membrane transport energization protein ExbD [Verrucomicrobium sp. GAS474]|uniref:ExbD/TolR family protein n=1 Tax=Verrucomicrobium sp. GAS474 TaxID=1882831 RepID=UPI00087BEA3C|nr:biopolymer transporter ExbD [Verrucomicrobium sp. GAS474]SDT92421.1 outer membrane transport energization protein ExbD [Verrucomicrobium sp. GAS474]
MARLVSPRAKSRPRLEIIPFIDVMFFLLATFMMVSLTLVENHAIPVNLPKAVTAAPQERHEEVALTVKEDGTIYWNKEAVAIEALPARLDALKKTEDSPRIFIHGDEKALFGKAIAVLDAVRSSGITKVAFETGKNPK